MKTPIALIVYNRPEQTRKVLACIQHAKPEKLFVIADGPSSEKEQERCRNTREIFDNPGWDCEIIRNFSDINLGCKERVTSGLNWLFDKCKQAIILEDDCVPDPTFFKYCEILLKNYRENSRIKMISGQSFLPSDFTYPYSYYFSRLTLIWGWATWRDRWKEMDLEMKNWPELRASGWVLGLWGNQKIADEWKSKFDDVYQGGLEIWDYQWTYSVWFNDGLTIIPKKNMVSNIGFHQEATHTRNPKSKLAGLKTHQMRFPLSHPEKIYWQKNFDLGTLRQIKHLSKTRRNPLLRLPALVDKIRREITPRK